MPDWTSMRLGDVMTIKHGFAFPGSDFSEDPTLPTLVTPGNFMIGGGFQDARPKTFAGDVPAEYVLRPGDLVVTMTDLSRNTDTLGYPGLIPDGKTYLHNQRIGLVEVTQPSKIHHQFLNYYMRGAAYRNHVVVTASGSTVRHTSPSRILSFVGLVPSLDMQRGIAEVLGALDDKIAANTRLRSASENLLRANFEALGIDTSPVEGTQLHEVVALNPTTPKPAEEVAVYLEMKHLPDSSMTVTSWSYREPRGGARFVNGDTLLARITPCLENGKTGHVDFLAQGQVGIGSTEYIVMRAKTDTPTVLPYFLATSPAFRDVAIRRMVGTSGRQRLSAADIADYLVSWPSADKLVTFDRLASSLMPRVKAATDETRHLIETRDALLPLLMSGKVSVKDAESVVGEVL